MGAFTSWCRNSKAFCECPFALQRQQPEKDAKCRRCTPLEKFLRMPLATFVLSASFDIWASQVKLTMYEIEN